MKLKHIKQIVLNSLQGNPMAGGIEVSDGVLRWASWLKGRWNLASLRLPPGILVQGEIKRYQDFVSALLALRSEIGMKSKKIKIPVVISLGSMKVFSQIITLPLLDEDKLSGALELNMRMSSPIPFEQAYSSSQFIRRDEDKGTIEFLASFIDKTVVDELTKAFSEAGFVPMIVEPRGISLTRVIRKSPTFEYSKSYIVLNIDSSGLEYAVIKSGNLYFDYFTSWQELEKENLSLEGLKNNIVRGLHQVLNFYKTHWPDPIDSILLSSVNVGEDVQKIIEDNFPFKVNPLNLNLSETMDNEWIIALGAGIRSTVPRAEDEETSLLGLGAKEAYREEQVISFLFFWRVLTPLVLGVVLLGFVGVNFLLSNASNRIDLETPLKLSSEQLTEVATLQSQVSDFNKKVDMLYTLQTTYKPKVELIKRLKVVTDLYQLNIDRITYGTNNSITFSGDSTSNETIISFRKVLAATDGFVNVNLPFNNIQTSPLGFSFTMTFTFIP